MLKTKLYGGLLLLAIAQLGGAQPINRQALVQRHNVKNTRYDSLSSLTVGNGAFAFTADITGLQSFPEAYAGGVSLGTQSEWGWHSFPNVNNYRFSETLRNYQLDGKTVSYSVQSGAVGRGKEAVEYFRQNVHRLQLGNLGFEILLKNGTPARLSDIKNVNQVLDVWTGEIRSAFTVEGVPVTVSTVAHPVTDQVSVQVTSSLIKDGRIKVSLILPFPTANFLDEGVNYASPDLHSSRLTQQSPGLAVITHTLDTTTYHVQLQWNGKGVTKEIAKHHFLLEPSKEANSFHFTCTFVNQSNQRSALSKSANEHAVVLAKSAASWKAYWTKGAAIDFSGSTDKRAHELERRVVLSQYLLRVQEAGKQPPQETGLTFNSWFGKPHLEMHWWHSAQYALWNRTELLEKSMEWYSKPAVYKNAKELAMRQGYEGVRWQKMTDPDGNEGPSSVGAFLIWQQPHFIYFAELCYRNNPAALAKYKNLVFETADFMASYARYDSATQRYVLGRGLIPAQETFKAEETINPSFELTYWHWALTVAQQWRVRAGLPRNKKYDAVLAKLSPLPQKDGLYYPTESATDSYTNPKYRTDHPIVLGNMGMLAPLANIDTAVMNRTFDWVWNNWTWPHTWGWDFPLTAMAATRLGRPEKAIEALLMNITTNTYLSNGHNYQDGRLRIYLPGNGGLLTAVAMMVEGYDGSTVKQPGIPKNGTWKVRSEGLKKMP